MKAIKTKAELNTTVPAQTANTGFTQVPNAITMCFD